MTGAHSPRQRPPRGDITHHLIALCLHTQLLCKHTRHTSHPRQHGRCNIVVRPGYIEGLVVRLQRWTPLSLPRNLDKVCHVDTVGLVRSAAFDAGLNAYLASVAVAPLACHATSAYPNTRDPVSLRAYIMSADGTGEYETGGTVIDGISSTFCERI